MVNKRFGRGVLLMSLVLALAVAVVGCGKPKETPSTGGNTGGSTSGVTGSIVAGGSTALQPLVDAAAQQFMAKNPGAQISVQGGGSGTGLTQVLQGGFQIGNSDLFAEEKLKPEEASQLKDHKVCVVAMAAVVHPGVGAKVTNLTKQQMIDIWTGKITNWKDVGGPDVKITLVNRPASSGTRATFKKFALDGKEEAKGIEQEASGTVKQIVSQTPGAIGYLALSYLDDSIKVVSLDGVAPTKENVANGTYPVWAYEHMYTKGEPSGLTKAFLDYILSDEIQKTLVVQEGYIPITDMKVERDASGNVKKL